MLNAIISHFVCEIKNRKQQIQCNMHNWQIFLVFKEPINNVFCAMLCMTLVSFSQDFAKSKAIPPGEEQTVYFPPVWSWSQQFSTKDQTLFNNPMYVGKGAPCVQNGEVKSFRRTKVQ